MPSPFPGMDPFLEHPEFFPELHDRLIVYLQDALQPLLPEPFFARTGRRVWIEEDQRHVEPDVDVLIRTRDTPPGEKSTTAFAGTHPVILTSPALPDDEFHESFLEIYTGRHSDKRLLTAIEVLSLFNKRPSSRGRDMFLAKQRELRAGGVHLVEIGLLRDGWHATAVPEGTLRSGCGSYDYHVCVHKADQPDKYFVYPFRLEDALPTIAIPLTSGVEMPVVDLQAVFTRCYDAARYDRELEYSADAISPPLSPERRAWAAERIAAHG